MQTKQQILDRLADLEMSLDGDNTDDDKRGEILDQIAELEESLEEVA
ncbi:hypothetical protein [Achromobacter xylosoxidans]|nr:hypothetical protein [Achromobacter xylosoxidans]